MKFHHFMKFHDRYKRDLLPDITFCYPFLSELIITFK